MSHTTPRCTADGCNKHATFECMTTREPVCDTHFMLGTAPPYALPVGIMQHIKANTRTMPHENAFDSLLRRTLRSQ